jgi:hypothetical protein
MLLRLNPMAFLLLASVAPIPGQDTAIRIDVKLVQVDAVATDSRGKHVGNLKAGDFVILQDGKPQAITNFSYIAAPSVPPAMSRGPASAHAPQIARVPLKTSDVRRMVALVVDDLALSSDGVAHVRDALHKFASRVSSILLRQDVHGADAGMNHAEGRVLDNDPATAAALRVFEPGSALFYDYLVFNAQSGETQKADLEVQTRLFRDGKLVYTGQPMVPSLTGEAASGRLMAGGHMVLANGVFSRRLRVAGDRYGQTGEAKISKRVAGDRF